MSPQNSAALQQTPDPAAKAPPSPWPGLSSTAPFFEDSALRLLMDRARAYVEAGICLHLSGPAGLGKTTLALRIAASIGRPISFMAGNQWLEASDFIGREVGKSTRTVVDKYIQSVRRTDLEERVDWKESILAEAMRAGHVLIYDEFTRASPEANAVLLSVLEEGALVSTDRASKRSVTEAHPAFRIILTSNPYDYVGVNSAPDALFDRMVTLPMPEPSDETVLGILMLRTGLDRTLAKSIVDLVARKRHTAPNGASRLRSALMIGRVAAHMARAGSLSSDLLNEVAEDVLNGRQRAFAAVAAKARPHPPQAAS